MISKLPSAVQAHGPVAVVAGRYALLLGKLLEAPLVLEAIERTAMDPSHRRDIDRARGELLAAGRCWWTSANGSARDVTPEVGALSEWVAIGELAELFGVTTRQARTIAEQLGGTKIGGRWQIERAIAEAEMARREEQQR